MKNINLRTYLSKCYHFLFHEDITEEAILFLKNISFVTVGTIVTIAFTFTFNILAGRLLGPSTYGHYGLVQSVSMFLYIPMLMGISTAMVKYNSEKIDVKRQRTIISTSFTLTVLSTAIFCILYIIFAEKITNLISISKNELNIAIIFAILFTFYTLTSNSLRSLHDMKTLSLLRPMYGIIMLGTFLALIKTNHMSYISMILSVLLSYLVISAIIIIKYRPYFQLKLDTQWAKKLIKYSNLTIMGGISCILYSNIDKILINRYMGTQEIGIYSSYYFASINVASMLTGIFITVFFPTISKLGDKKSILHKINLGIRYVVILAIPCLFLSQYVILKLYGSEYPIDIGLILLFILTSILFVCNEVYVWFFNSLGINGVKLTLISALTIAIFDIFLNILLIPIFGLYGAIEATALAYIFGLATLYTLYKKIKIEY